MKHLIMLSMIFLAGTIAGNGATLPASAQKHLTDNYPGWTVAKFKKTDSQKNEATATGDFNGDGKRDYAVAIEKDELLTIVIMLADGQNFRGFKLRTQSGTSRWTKGIGTTPKGSTIYLWDASREPTVPHKIKFDGVALYDSKGLASTFYFENDKFLEGWDK